MYFKITNLFLRNHFVLKFFTSLTICVLFSFIAVSQDNEKKSDSTKKSKHTDDYRVFKNSNGKEIEAKIISATNTSVKIKTKQGKIFNSKLIFFSKEDRKFIKEWVKNNIRYSIEIDYSKKIESKQKEKNVKSYDYVYKNFVWEFKIANRSSHDLENVEILYTIYKHNSQKVGNIRDWPIKKFKGKTKVQKINKIDPFIYKTNVITFKEAQLNYQYDPVGRANSKFRDSFFGLRLIIKHKNKVIEDYQTDKVVTYLEKKKKMNKLDDDLDEEED